MAVANVVLDYVRVFYLLLIKWPALLLVNLVKLFWSPKKDVSKDIVLVTGGGSGIGKLLALKFSRLGCQVVLWDVNEAAVKEAAKEIEAETKNKAFAYAIDLRQRQAVYALADRVRKEVGEVSILVNNAGIVTGKKLLEAPDESMQATMDVNATAHFWTLKAFLPQMMEKNHGHVVTIASSAGHVGVSGLVDYCASKHAAVGIDESLRFELRKQKKFGIKTTCVNPYFISTGMFEGSRTKFRALLPILTPEYAASKILDAVLTNQEVLFMPRFLYLNHFFRFVLPIPLMDEITEALGASDSMDHFVGRQKAQ